MTLFRLLFLSLFFAPSVQAQEQKAALPKGYREVGPDKETALRELCQATADTGLFSGAVLVADGKVLAAGEPDSLPAESYAVANMKGLSPEQLFESVLVATGAEAVLAGNSEGVDTMPLPVHELGVLTPGRMALAMAAADAVVVPSRMENLPNMVAESLACGTPVAAFAVGGIPEMIRPGETGMLATPQDPEELAHGICELLKQGGQMREACAAYAREEYAPETVARRHNLVQGKVTDHPVKKARTKARRDAYVAPPRNNTPRVNVTPTDMVRGSRHQTRDRGFVVVFEYKNANRVSVYFENDDFSVRASYNWKDDRANGIHQGYNLYTKDYGQLDVNASYNLTDALSFTASVVNLTEEIEEGYWKQSNRFTYNQYSGRRFYLGANYNF